MNTCLSCGVEIAVHDQRCPNCGVQVNSHAAKLVGTTLADKYLIEELLGVGGMCYVYCARHIAMGKQVAIKVLKPELAADPKIAERFEQEARAASRIHHPHAINVTDYGEAEDKTPYIVMELIKGHTLGELLRSDGALPLERAANILRQVSGALEAAHAVGVVHRDIKPDNIIIAEYDGSDWVEVVDFGVAKIQEDVNRRPALTGSNVIVGTPRYMSPEQCDERPVDQRSDIYSLGVVLYEMLTGEAPFPGNSSTRLLMAHATEPPPPLRQKRPDLSPELESVVMKALEKDPSRRQQSAGELSQEFEQAAGFGQAARAGTVRGGAFSRISVPLGEAEAATPQEELQSAETDGESTVVRPRTRPAAAPVDTPPYQRVDTPYNARPLDPQQMAYGEPGAVPLADPRVPSGAYIRTSREYGGRGGMGWVLGLIALLVVSGVVAYLAFGDRLFGKNTTSDAVVDAQQAITDAIARIDQLPKDHPLRTYMPQLSEMHGELKAYKQVQEYNPEIIQRAERYQQKAEDISAQARAAAQTSTPAAPVPATAGSNTSPTAPREAASEDPEEEEEAEEPDEAESKNANSAGKANENKNINNNRRSEPPVMDPVKPTPSDQKPANSNKPRNDSPPSVDRIRGLTGNK